VAALQTVGAFLVIAMVVIPGATAYLLSDKFSHVIFISISIGSLTSLIGAYLSYFIDGATGGIIVLIQAFIFLLSFFFAPKYGVISNKRKQQSLSLD
jgi:manganese/iron transport system permease protein